MLPELVPPGRILGRSRLPRPSATGIPAGLPLIAAAADKACEVLGAGCLEPHIGCISYGTTATINTTHRKYIEIIPLIPPYPAAVPGALQPRGADLPRLLDGELVQAGVRATREEDRRRSRASSRRSCSTNWSAGVPPGSMGLVLQPYWSPGLKVPGPEAKGAVIGFGDVHTRGPPLPGDPRRAGLCAARGQGADAKSAAGTPITELRVAGGGSQSDAAMQITADVFGLPASRPHVYETSGLGAAIDAAVGLGLHPDFAAAVGRMTRTGKTFLPDPKTRDIYEKLYSRVYLQMYGRLKPLYEEIRDITGYPGRPA